MPVVSVTQPETRPAPVMVSVPPVDSGALVSASTTAALERIAASLVPLMVTCTEVVVPSANVVGPVGLGFVTFMKSLDTGRLGLGAAGLGGAEAALDLMGRYAGGRMQFGRPLSDKQSIQWMIANLATEIEALRSLVYRTAWLVDTGQPYTREAAMCKMFGSEGASRACDRALQVHGALGYNRDFPVERMWRDARIAEIFEGTNEIQRIVIAEQVMRQYGVRVRP